MFITTEQAIHTNIKVSTLRQNINKDIETRRRIQKDIDRMEKEIAELLTPKPNDRQIVDFFNEYEPNIKAMVDDTFVFTYKHHVYRTGKKNFRDAAIEFMNHFYKEKLMKKKCPACGENHL